MTNIKDISKQLMGGSLNNFHRKVGLKQIENNNEMQTKVLQGIYGQIDDAYIEKTEESNVIHLDGSGDGVVEVVSIEGNSMVNIAKNVNPPTDSSVAQFERAEIIDKGNYVEYKFINALVVEAIPRTDWSYKLNIDLIEGRTYTVIIPNMPLTQHNRNFLLRDNGNVINYQSPYGVNRWSFVATKNGSGTYAFYVYTTNTYNLGDTIIFNMPKKIMILEGDWTNKEVNYSEGLQSSFEEKQVDDKYEVEILLNNKNLFDGEMELGGYDVGSGCKVSSDNAVRSVNKALLKAGNYVISNSSNVPIRIFMYDNNIKYLGNTLSNSFTLTTNGYIALHFDKANMGINIQIEKGSVPTLYTPHKSNKIKVLVNEPLRMAYNRSDKPINVDDNLSIERNNREVVINEILNNNMVIFDNVVRFDLGVTDAMDMRAICNKLPLIDGYTLDKEHFYIYNNRIYMFINKSKLSTLDKNGLNSWLSNNPIKIIYTLKEPFYEEVLNEYGEPILLEGYENGTLYIDSVIIPTTTVRYTPKMESYKEVKNVEKENHLLYEDINENIISYMMDIDMMILEKEMELLSPFSNIKNYNNREVLDMTSMQKRTFDMLVRLIKGQTLTKEECCERVTVYLEADRITSEQSVELMLLIEEIYN